MQRSVEDPKVLVVTYEGEHNHDIEGGLPVASSVMDAKNTNGGSRTRVDDQVHSAQKSKLEQFFFIQQMATSLTRDPNFTAALATAISARILD